MTTETQTFDTTTRQIPREAIHIAYTGKIGCCCGCKGNYCASKTCPAEYLNPGEWNEKKIHQPTIEKVARLLEKNPETRWFMGLGQKILSVDTETRRYNLYLDPSVDLSAFPKEPDPVTPPVSDTAVSDTVTPSISE